MPGWAWWLIWVGLALASAGYLGYLGLNLLAKASRAAKALELGAKKVEAFTQALETKAELTRFEGNLMDDPAPLVAEHARNLKKREAKRQERQRRLIAKLIDYDESEFKP